MASDSENLDRVNRLIEDLQERYTEVPVEDQREVLPANEFDSVYGDGSDYVGAAAAWVVRTPEDASAVSDTFYGEPGSSKRVLFHLPRGSDTWGLPGGGLEAGGLTRFRGACLTPRTAR